MSLFLNWQASRSLLHIFLLLISNSTHCGETPTSRVQAGAMTEVIAFCYVRRHLGRPRRGPPAGRGKVGPRSQPSVETNRPMAWTRERAPPQSGLRVNTACRRPARGPGRPRAEPEVPCSGFPRQGWGSERGRLVTGQVVGHGTAGPPSEQGRARGPPGAAVCIALSRASGCGRHLGGPISFGSDAILLPFLTVGVCSDIATSLPIEPSRANLPVREC